MKEYPNIYEGESLTSEDIKEIVSKMENLRGPSQAMNLIVYCIEKGDMMLSDKFDQTNKLCDNPKCQSCCDYRYISNNR